MKTAAFGLTLVLLLPLWACGGGNGSDTKTSPSPSATSVSLTRAFPSLTFSQPTALVQRPGDDARWYLLEKGGRVLTFTPQDPAPSVALDIRDRVESAPSEAGLLGIAFHPDFASNRQLFLSYTAPGSPLVSRISRFTSADGRTIDPASEEILLTLNQPFANHNGGQIAFGPDGFLYIGFGDGGSGGDPQGNGQNLGTLLGKILRIDVNTRSEERAYGLPPGNPFAGGGGRPEIFAWGLRNPWRFSFDRTTGKLWAADVGQDAWEEVDIVERGKNYGWDIREGAHCFEPPQGCRTEGLTDPVAEYPNAADDCSVTGGYVYRGTAVPGLAGTYLYGDFCSGRVWGLPLGADGNPSGAPRLLADSDVQISSFAEGNDGEVYLLNFGGGTVHRVAPAGAAR